MDVTEMTTIFVSVVGVLTPLLGVGTWRYKRQTKRLKEAEAKLAEVTVDKAKVETRANDWDIWKDQLVEERKHVKFQDERITELLKENDAKDDKHRQDIKEWETRFTKQTEYLRGVQRELTKYGEERLELTREIGELKLELAKKRCDDMSCPFREPPTSYTLPQESNMSKEEYFNNKLTNG